VLLAPYGQGGEVRWVGAGGRVAGVGGGHVVCCFSTLRYWSQSVEARSGLRQRESVQEVVTDGVVFAWPWQALNSTQRSVHTLVDEEEERAREQIVLMQEVRCFGGCCIGGLCIHPMGGGGLYTGSA
jgi:hypothetical protein